MMARQPGKQRWRSPGLLPLVDGTGSVAPVLLAAGFAGTLFTSACLLFLVQPMIGKMILPRLGGAPAVWTTCMVFFQAALLLGYLYAHLSTTWLGPRRQALLHAGLLLTVALFLPIGLPADWLPAGDASPALWLLGLLAAAVGVPFVVLATTAPLLQRWFADTGHPSARDPYFLYAASNLGSMAALLAYPFLVEPELDLTEQSTLWTAGYALLIAMMLGCAWSVRRAPAATAASPSEAAGLTPTLGQRLRWIALAGVPSSLLLSVTTFLSTDIAPIPLLWVVPLALYLLSFILAFANLPAAWQRGVVRLAPVSAALLIFLLATGYKPPMLALIGLYLAAFLVIAWSAHGELARTRPDTRHLTEFYLWLSLGGVLGGLFNSLAAPFLFKTLAELPLAVGAACLLLPAPASPSRRWLRLALGLPVVLAAAIAAATLVYMLGGFNPGRLVSFLEGIYLRWLDGLFDLGRISAAIGLSPSWLVNLISLALGGLLVVYLFHQRKGLLPRLCDLLLPAALCLTMVALILVWRTDFWELERLDEAMTGKPGKLLAYGIPLLLGLTLVGRPVRFTLALGGVLLAGTFYDFLYGNVVYRERSFFGTLCVEYRPGDDSFNLYHGTTLHGKQYRDAGRRRQALTYYHASGPIGQVFGSYTGPGLKPAVAIVGLGTGTLASYGLPGQRLTFYEIDPAVERLATSLGFFTYVPDASARGVVVQTIRGDARLRLREAPAGAYGLIVIDAFSSDAIPTHLLTREALWIYLDKLAEGGQVAFHISNRYLDLEPVLFRLAEDAGLVGLIQDDEEDPEVGKAGSSWVVLARRPADFDPLAVHHRLRWRRLIGNDRVGLWTDSYSNLLSVFK